MRTTTISSRCVNIDIDIDIDKDAGIDCTHVFGSVGSDWGCKSKYPPPTHLKSS